MTSFHNYGLRGIGVCGEWEHDFMAFYTWAIQSGYSKELTLERISVDLGYSPDNCKWVDPFEQQSNKRNTKYLEVDGKRIKFIDYLRSINRLKDYPMLEGRIYKCGWTPEDALTKPSEKNIFHKKRV